MAFHTDCALDLQPGTDICIFSSYEDPAEPDPKHLLVKDKATGRVFQVPMAHNTAVVFSVEANARHLHKVVSRPRATSSRWLGLTFRTSRTHVRPADCGGTCDGKPLTLATEAQRVEFRRHKSRENRATGYQWPPIDFLMEPLVMQGGARSPRD